MAGDQSPLETDHRVIAGDARDMPLDDESVDLVVTSPPYPMIEMWDDAFTGLDPRIGEALEAEDGDRAYELMHEILAPAWKEVERVLVPGGIAAVNVGDATRTLGDGFQLYPNHAEIIRQLSNAGLTPLPDILWRKPANSAAKFMGSGTVPPNAYVTLEHEYILLARKGGLRRPEPEMRSQSSYFWEERNRWFSDLWEVRGERQALDVGPRDRTAAFPFEIPYRLINMFSVQGETVLDPFWGTGTTTIAAMASGRSSVGVDVDEALVDGFDPVAANVRQVGNERSRRRLETHLEFVAQRDDDPKYESLHYDTRVITKRERDLRLPTIESIEETATGWQVEHGWVST